MFQHRIIESRPAEYKRPVFFSNWSAFTPDRWRGSCSSLMVKDTVTFLLGMVWLCGWVCEWPEQGRTPAAILHFFFCQLLFSFPIRHSRALSIVSSRDVTQRLACVASVSVRFSSKERGRRVKDRGKKAQVKQRGGGGEERKETLADKPLDFENRPLGFSCLNLMLSSAVMIDQ